MSQTTTGQLIDGIFASEALDSSGEILEIAGLDISDFDEGRGVSCYEHQNSDNPELQGQEIVGKVVFAKKIFKASDCSNEREKMFWEKVKPLPFLYGVVRLYDGAGHEGAKALAAIIRDSHANNEPLVVGFSIEGSTLEKDNKTNRLKSTIARRVAITLRPCNKTAVAQLLADPNAPEGYTGGVGPDVIAMVTNEKTEKTESNLQFARLGGSRAIYGTEVTKALTAGSYNAPPSALVGGAALQREDRGPKARAIKALNDWKKYSKKEPKGQEFKAFLKAQLPDVSDDFLDHFTQLVDDHMFKIKKAEQVIAELRKAGKEVKTPKSGKVKENKPPKLTIRGVPVTKPSKEVHFDEEKGVLRTPRGSFPMYIPSYHDADKGAAYNQLLQSSAVSKYHDTAMEHFVHAQKLFKAGQVPREMATHAAIFANLSINTAVPNQEHQYAGLVDAMGETGISPSTVSGPIVDVAGPSKPGKEPRVYQMHQSNKDLLEAWLARNDPDKLPDHSPSHFERLKDILTLKADAIDTGRKAGQFAAFQMPHEKMGNIAKIHSYVDGLVDLISKHRSGRAVSEELLTHKHLNNLHEARREATLARGQPDIGPYTGGPVIKGLAPKTLRYALGMLGAGDVQVPDTHHVRHTFGLDKSIKSDAESIDYIKNLLWDDKRGAPLLAAMDRYYAQHHDAAKHMLQHPKWGRYFQSPEDAIFPAFWKGWTAIVPHEKSRGMKSGGFNEGTDHLPYWEAVQQFYKSEDVYQPNLSYDTAVQHLKWVHDLGPIAAMRLYYTYLVPLLIKNEQARQTVVMRKFEETQIDTMVLLAKAIAKAKEPKPQPVKPTVPETEEETPERDYHSIAKNAVPGFNHLPHSQEVLNSGLDLLKHQVQLRQPDEGGIGGAATRKDTSYWTRAPDGTHYYVKKDPGHYGPGFSESHREAIYANMAHEYFGLGHYVPSVALVKDHDEDDVAVIKGVHGKNLRTPSEIRKAVEPLHQNGDAHKLLAMNWVMGNADRHSGNFLVHPDEGVKLIDHGLILNRYLGYLKNADPEYLTNTRPPAGTPSIHPEAQKWIAGLTPEALREHLAKYSVPKEEIDLAQQRLAAIKKVYAEEAHLPHSAQDLWRRAADTFNEMRTGVRYEPGT